EHLNVRFWMEYLKKNDANIKEAFRHQSIGINPSKDIGKNYMAAFDIQDKIHLDEVNTIAKEGLQIFDDLFGFPSVFFTPSALIHSNGMHSELKKCHINFIDMARQRMEPTLNGKYKKHFHYMGQKNN